MFMRKDFQANENNCQACSKEIFSALMSERLWLNSNKGNIFKFFFPSALTCKQTYNNSIIRG